MKHHSHSMSRRLLAGSLVVALGALQPLGAMAATVPEKSSSLETATDPTPVTVNRSVPKVTPPSSSPRFSSVPSTAEISAARVFEEPLVAVGGVPSGEENAALARSVTASLRVDNPQAAALYLDFLKAYPASSWRASLLTNLGIVHRRAGEFTRALEAWETAWKLARDGADPAARSVADRALGELLELHLMFGHQEAIEETLQEIEGRDVQGSAAQKVSRAREGAWILRYHHEDALPSGPTALRRIVTSLRADQRMDAELAAVHGSPQGMSLDELQALAGRVGLGMKMAFRTGEVEVAVPSVVHFKVGHFSAMIREEGGSYLLDDPVLGGPFWMSSKVLNEETSGYFLVPEGKLGRGWREATAAETAGVRGKCIPELVNPQQIKNCSAQAAGSGRCCPPMAVYSIHLLASSLHVTDTPVEYTPSRGPRVSFQVNYNQRESAQPQTFPYSNLGRNWTFDWISYVTDDPVTPGSSAVEVYLRGAGGETFGPINGVGASPPHLESRAVMARTALSPIRYERRLPDGSVEIFDLPDGANPRKVFLTQIVDPQGQTLSFTYDASYRLAAVTDALGQVTTLSYEHSTDPLKITKVADPFGRYATFEYNPAGQLARITDVIGIQSSFTYGPADSITSLTTPYGTTRFEMGEASGTRWVETTDALGGVERVEYDYYASDQPASDPAWTVPSGMGPSGVSNFVLSQANTYYWDKRAMALRPGDRAAAELTHWLRHEVPFVVSGIPHSKKRPLENRVWYSYVGQSSLISTGAQSKPAAVGRVLDDGTSQVWKYEQNTKGKTIKKTDPLGRETAYVYGTGSTPDADPSNGTGVDLLQIKQKNADSPGGYDLMASYTYDARHQALTRTDASGQTTAYTHLADGRIDTGVSPARNGPNGQPLTAAERTTTYTYYPDDDANPAQRKRLHAVTGPSSPQGPETTVYTYDSRGRLRTVTDSDSYTLTYDYDTLDRQTRVTYPDGTYEETVYGFLEAEGSRDRLGRWSHTFHDPLGRPRVTRDPLGRTVRRDYSTWGDLDRLVDGNGNATRFEYDLQGRITKEYRANSPVPWESTYENTTSRLKQRRDPKQQAKTCEYFLDDNVKQLSYSGPSVTTPPVIYTYHSAHNRLSTTTDGTGLTTYNYRPYTSGLGRGLLESVDGPLPSDTVSYTYDEMGRIASRGLTGFLTTFPYDSLGRLAREGSPLGDFIYAYDGPTDRVLSLNYPNGQRTSYVYLPSSGDHLLEEIKHLAPSGDVLSRFNYTYDKVSNIKTWHQQYGTSPAHVYDLAYDPADQLTAATLRSTEATPVMLKRYGYAYDAAGNRTAEQVDDAAMEEVPNARNQLVTRLPGGVLIFRGTVNEPATVTVQGRLATTTEDNRFEGSGQPTPGTNTVIVTATDLSSNVRTNTYQVPVSGTTTNYIYDLNGNLTSDGTKIFEWDAENRLTAVKQGMTTLASFTYDGQGRRTTKTTAGTTRTYVYDNENIVEERLSTGPSTEYMHGPGVDQPLASRDQAAAVSYYLTDHLGSIVQATSPSGQVSLTRQYDPWGNLLVGASTSGYAYTGREWDAEIGLYYYRARYYEPKLGRLASEDPIGFAAGTNFYTYALNNPPRFRDPTGTDVYYLNSPSSAKGFGHSAVIVGGHDDDIYTFHSFQPKPRYIEVPYMSFKEALAGALREYPFTAYAQYCTKSAANDEAAREKGREFRNKEYDVGKLQCDDMTSEMAWAAGIVEHVRYGTPNKTFQGIVKANSAPITKIE